MSHFVAFTFISFLKRKRKLKMKLFQQSQSGVWYANPRKESLPWNFWPCCLDSKSFLNNYIKQTKQKVRGIKKAKNVLFFKVQNLQLNVFGKIDIKRSHRAIYTWINVTTKNRTWIVSCRISLCNKCRVFYLWISISYCKLDQANKAESKGHKRAKTLLF